MAEPSYADARGKPSKYQDVLGISPAEFDLSVAVLAHEKVYGEPPTRLALADFFAITSPHTERLVRFGLLIVTGKPIRLASTVRLKRLLGVEAETRVA